MNRAELLMPSGDLARCKIALDYGADAVYLGGKSFSLRARASNFTNEDIKAAVVYAHNLNKKIYVTVNMIFHDEDLMGIEEYLKYLDEIRVDAIIVASTYLLILAKKLKCRFEVHMSTQLSLLNSLDVQFYQELGADRVVLARELDIASIQKLQMTSQLPLEVFLHGAMCANYSGRCTLSNEMTLRDANRGGCAQSCRWKYYLYHDDQLVSDKNTLFSMSSKDLKAIDYLKDLLDCGVASLKVEGRMKSAYYLASVASTYREFIDLYYHDKIACFAKIPEFKRYLASAENRLASDGFFKAIPDHNGHLYGINGAGVNHEFVGVVLNSDSDLIKVQVRNVIRIGDTIECFGPNKANQSFTISKIYNEDKEEIEVANKPMSVIYLPKEIIVNSQDMLRKIND
ncbi:MAG: peptidase U32 family protein [Erysipelotrichaceae bacterium]